MSTSFIILIINTSFEQELATKIIYLNVVYTNSLIYKHTQDITLHLCLVVLFLFWDETVDHDLYNALLMF